MACLHGRRLDFCPAGALRRASIRRSPSSWPASGRPTRASWRCPKRTAGSCASWSARPTPSQVLEIGAASGYSAIWIGMGLRQTGGKLTTIEFDPVRAREAAANVQRAGLSDIVRVVPGDAFQEIPKVAGTFDLVFLDAWKPDYKKFFDMVFPRVNPGRAVPRAQRDQQEERHARFPRGDREAPDGAQHHGVAGPRGDFDYVQEEIGIRHQGSDRIRDQGSVMRAVHIIGVPLDLGGNRRGTDMGPSAFRIAGLGEQLAKLGLHVVDKGDVPSPIPEAQGRGRSAQALREGHRAGLPALVPDVAVVVLGRRDADRARRRSQPRRRIGRGGGGAHAQAAASRSD